MKKIGISEEIGPDILWGFGNIRHASGLVEASSRRRCPESAF